VSPEVFCGERLTFEPFSNTFYHTMKSMLLIWLVAVLPLLAQAPTSKLQRNELPDTSQRLPLDRQAVDVRGHFLELEKGLAAGSVSFLLGMIGQQVYIDIVGGEQGYFSSNQAASLLQSFFAQRRPIAFTFSSVNQRAPSPYATGRYTFLHRGTRESVQIYVALTRQDSRWTISHFNIY
jgi:hypothetical protein